MYEFVSNDQFRWQTWASTAPLGRPLLKYDTFHGFRVGPLRGCAASPVATGLRPVGAKGDGLLCALVFALLILYFCLSALVYMPWSGYFALGALSECAVPLRFVGSCEMSLALPSQR